MNTNHKTSGITKKMLALAAVVVMLFSFNAGAQTRTSVEDQKKLDQNQRRSQGFGQTSAPTDTINIIQYNNDLNFDLKRSVVFTDKRSIDSLANEIAADSKMRGHIVFRKEGKQGKEISRKDFIKLDRSGLYRIMIAYNKKGLPDDDMPIYILTSK